MNRHGLGVIWAATAWGAAIVAFGFAHERWLALAALVLAGAADMISGVFRMTIWNQTIPDRLRGRLAGVEMLSYSIGPTLGNVESGLTAKPFGVRGSIIVGGAACVVGVGVLAVALPGFRRYDGRDGMRRREAEETAYASDPAVAALD